MRKNILWIDDQHDEMLPFKGRAKRNGIILHGFKSVESGYKELERNPTQYDAVLLDINLFEFEDDVSGSENVGSLFSAKEKIMLLPKKFEIFILTGQVEIFSSNDFKLSFPHTYLKGSDQAIDQLFKDILSATSNYYSLEQEKLNVVNESDVSYSKRPFIEKSVIPINVLNNVPGIVPGILSSVVGVFGTTGGIIRGHNLTAASKSKIIPEENKPLPNQISHTYISIAHSLGKPKQRIIDRAENLLVFIKDNKSAFSALDKQFSEDYFEDFTSLLAGLKNDASLIHDVINRGSEGFETSKFPIIDLPVSDIISLIEDIFNNEKVFKLKKQINVDQPSYSMHIKGNENLLRILLDNIITNAEKHAFDNYDVENLVVIDVSVSTGFLKIMISNNGKPFPQNYTKRQFISQYQTSDKTKGSGLGGYDIDQIITHFNSYSEFSSAEPKFKNNIEHNTSPVDLWDLRLDNKEYPVIFEFNFQLLNN